jgi:predicted Fe-S protein YdhL (DUF1289 family)
MMQSREEEHESDLECAIARARLQQPVGSPCIDVCRLDPLTGYCEGCFRSRDEIKAWRSMSDAEKLQLLDRLPERSA